MMSELEAMSKIVDSDKNIVCLVIGNERMGMSAFKIKVPDLVIVIDPNIGLRSFANWL